MQYQAEQHVAPKDVGAVTTDYLRDAQSREIEKDADPATTLGLRKLAPGETCSIMDLKGCLAGRRPPPSRQDVAQAVDDAESPDKHDADPTTTLGLPPLAPGQTCSIMDLKGCLAGRRQGSPLTDDEIEAAIDAEVCARYLRSFA